jgi:hypothetical protein
VGGEVKRLVVLVVARLACTAQLSQLRSGTISGFPGCWGAAASICHQSYRRTGGIWVCSDAFEELDTENEQLAELNALAVRMSRTEAPLVEKRALGATSSGGEEASSSGGPLKKKREADPVPVAEELGVVNPLDKNFTLSKGVFISRHRLWLSEWGEYAGLCPRREHCILSLALDAAVSLDGLDIKNLKFAEVLLLRKEEIEQAVAGLTEDLCPDIGLLVSGVAEQPGVVSG